MVVKQLGNSLMLDHWVAGSNPALRICAVCSISAVCIQICIQDNKIVGKDVKASPTTILALRYLCIV